MSTSVTIVGGMKLVQKMTDSKVQTVSAMMPHHSRDPRDEEIKVQDNCVGKPSATRNVKEWLPVRNVITGGSEAVDKPGLVDGQSSRPKSVCEKSTDGTRQCLKASSAVALNTVSRNRDYANRSI
ncbi:uncharacterized protein LOC144883606 isoform X2 [Branchiostoma floridae x Branchiostoma japonicum]